MPGFASNTHDPMFPPIIGPTAYATTPKFEENPLHQPVVNRELEDIYESIKHDMWDLKSRLDFNIDVPLDLPDEPQQHQQQHVDGEAMEARARFDKRSHKTSTSPIQTDYPGGYAYYANPVYSVIDQYSPPVPPPSLQFHSQGWDHQVCPLNCPLATSSSPQLCSDCPPTVSSYQNEILTPISQPPSYCQSSANYDCYRVDYPCSRLPPLIPSIPDYACPPCPSSQYGQTAQSYPSTSPTPRGLYESDLSTSTAAPGPRFTFYDSSPPLTTHSSSTPSPYHQWEPSSSGTSSPTNAFFQSAPSFHSSDSEDTYSLFDPHAVKSEVFDTHLVASPKKSSSSSRRRKERKLQLWEYMLDMLNIPDNASPVEWVNSKEGLFRICSQSELVRRWRTYRHRDQERYTFEKLTRTLRHYYPKGFLTKIQGKQNLYKYNFDNLPPRTDID